MPFKESKNIVFFKMDIENLGPLRIGSEEGILIDKTSKKPYIPATSICGTLKNYLKEVYDGALIDKFWGSESNESCVMVFDSYGSNLNIERRTSIKIDSLSGTNEDKHKFDLEYLGKGNKFQLMFKAYMKNEEESNIFRNMMMDIIYALDKKTLRFGGSKTNGAGICRVIKAEVCYLDLQNPKDLKSYLFDSINYENISLNLDEIKINENILEIQVTCETSGPILIQGQSSNDHLKADMENIRNVRGDYIIPGSSLKGVLRNRVRRILSLKNEENLVIKAFGSEIDSKDDRKISGNVLFEDIEIRNSKSAFRPSVKLDKFTQKPFEGALSSYESIQGEMKFNIFIKKKQKDVDDKILALIMLALRDLCSEGLTIGGGATIGRGRITGSKIVVRTPDRVYEYNLNREIDKDSLDYINEKIAMLN